MIENKTFTWWDDVNEDDDLSNQIGVKMFGRVVVVPYPLFLETHDAVADIYRDEGLSGDDLDEAISAALPIALAQALGIDHHETIH